MNFRTFLNEVEDVTKMDTSSVELKPVSKNDGYGNRVTGFESHFANGESNYTVEMDKIAWMDFNGTHIPDAYMISFSIDKSNKYSLTNSSGGQAHGIYTKMLMAVKKLVDTVKVDSLSFVAADDYMYPVYERFAKQFLKKDFTQVRMGEFVRSSTLKEIIAQSPPDEQRRLYKDLLDSNRDKVNTLNGVRERKKMERTMRMALPKMIGKVVYKKSSYNDKDISLAYLASVDRTSSIIKIIDLGRGMPRSISDTMTNLIFDRMPDESTVRGFLQQISDEPGYVLSQPLAVGLKALMQQHGIPVPETQSRTGRYSPYAS